MKLFPLVLIITLFPRCYAQTDYNTKLAKSLEQIRSLSYFDNSVVIYEEPGYDADFPVWNATDQYYVDDVVSFTGGTLYQAIKDNNGQSPDTSRSHWWLKQPRRPYLFLRDSARIEDLKSLLKADHPSVRVYAFAAMAFRNINDLFPIILENLGDTTLVLQFTSDYGYYVCPADLMMQYTLERFSAEQKNILQKLIVAKYHHLVSLKEILIFHKPSDEEYNHVRALTSHERYANYAVIALATYQKHNDVELIKAGFQSRDDYYLGVKIFFKAIENFPHPSFKEELLRHKVEIKKDDDLSDYLYYLNALSVYRDKQCFDILRLLVDLQMTYPNEGSYFGLHTRHKNLALIYRALKKYHSPMYDDLIKKIETVYDNSALNDSSREFKSLWDY